MKRFIWVDDVRPIPEEYVEKFGRDMCSVCATYDEAIRILSILEYRVFFHGEIYISLDHDLGDDKSGYDVAKWIVENQFPLTGFKCHSMNPVGRKNIEQLLTHYDYTEGGF